MREGFFRVAQRGGVWQFVTPDGKPFFSAGVCCVDEGAAREHYKPDRPEYAAFRHYPNTEAWARAAVARLRDARFNTIGGWSTDSVRHRGLPYTVVLHLATYVEGGIWGDLFSPNAERAFEKAVQQQVRPLRDDPDLLGWFTDNELGWWDESLFLYALKQPETSYTRRTLMRLLQRHYRNDFALLRRDFDVGTARSFAQLTPDIAWTYRPATEGGRGTAVVDRFMQAFAARYYQLARDAIRRHDPNHLILGDRYAQWYPASVARAAAPYVDVVSTNMGADWTSGAICRFFLERLHRLTKRPILISEYYFAAMENRSGNRNTSGGFPTVGTQRERAAAFRANLTAMASLPYVIGAHWFQYYDEPSLGRGDGENYNMGLMDIADRPYAELNAAAKEVQGHIPALRARLTLPRGLSPVLVPAASPRAAEGMRYWDTSRSFVKSAAEFPFADLYACWQPDRLYLAVHAADFVEAALFPEKKIPEAERMAVAVQGGTADVVTVRFGPGGEARTVRPEDAALLRRAENGATRSTVMLDLPPDRWSKKRFRAGEVLPLHVTLTRHHKAEQMEWRTTLRLR